MFRYRRNDSAASHRTLNTNLIAMKLENPINQFEIRIIKGIQFEAHQRPTIIIIQMGNGVKYNCDCDAHYSLAFSLSLCPSHSLYLFPSRSLFLSSLLSLALSLLPLSPFLFFSLFKMQKEIQWCANVSIRFENLNSINRCVCVLETCIKTRHQFPNR